MKRIDNISTVLYPEEEREAPIVQRFITLPGRDARSFQDRESLRAIVAELKESGIPSKEVLILERFQGRLFQQCPGSPDMICCNYLLLNIAFDCLYDCTYCFLRSYLNSYGITQFINTTDNIDEILIERDLDPDRVYRLGTGEFTDSLMMDETTGISRSLIQAFVKHENIMLELKTKSDNVDHLLTIDEKGNTVIAWSLNTEKNIKEYEPGTASLSARLDAAQRASDAGFLLAFHFDPVIFYPGCDDEYSALIDRLFSSVDHRRIAWISMGGLRYTSAFRDVLRSTSEGRVMAAQEMFPGQDGKLRYLKPLRMKIYRLLRDKIREYTPVPFIYLCMETSDVWERAFDMKFSSSLKLEIAFSNHLKKYFFC